MTKVRHSTSLPEREYCKNKSQPDCRHFSPKQPLKRTLPSPPLKPCIDSTDHTRRPLLGPQMERRHSRKLSTSGMGTSRRIPQGSRPFSHKACMALSSNSSCRGSSPLRGAARRVARAPPRAMPKQWPSVAERPRESVATVSAPTSSTRIPISTS